MQRYQVFIRCRELPAAHAEYTYSLNASAFHVAAVEGIKQFRREPRVRRRHLTCLELRVTVLGVAPRRQEIILPLGDSADGAA
jgi:hypothetical protein